MSKAKITHYLRENPKGLCLEDNFLGHYHGDTTVLPHFSVAAEAAANMDMQRNIEFINNVQRGQMIYDAYGTAVHHTTDLELIGEVLNATGDRHFGVHMTGLRPV